MVSHPITNTSKTLNDMLKIHMVFVSNIARVISLYVLKLIFI